MGDQEQKIERLAASILENKKAYYSGKPKISDEEYDAIEEELRRLAPGHPALKLVGYELQGKVKKVRHEVPMLSLAKTYDFNELKAWRKNEAVVGMLKVDGNSLSLVYKKGVLSLGKTRGNGEEGEDVTEKIFWISRIVKNLKAADDLEIRGEIYCKESQFVRLCDEMHQRGLDIPTNPRNIVAGILGRKEHIDLLSFCDFFAFDLIKDDLTITKEIEKFSLLEAMGFATPLPKLLRTDDELRLYLEFVRQKMEEDEIGIDGAVFSYDDLSSHKDLGSTSHHPRYKLSFKWQGQTATSKIQAILWSTSRLGIVTPVAKITPVLLSGAEISSVTLHNAAHVRLYNLKSGDEIEIVRSGEVIPKFLRVTKSGDGNVVLPRVCPSCDAALLDDKVRLFCPNTDNCPAQGLGQILNWVSCVGIDDLSEKRLQSMIALGLVKSPEDLYKLSDQDLLRLPLTKEKMALKLISNIQGSRNLPLARFLYGLGIKGGGLATWELVLSEYPELEQVMSLSENDLIKIKGFAEKSAGDLVTGLGEKKSLIERLLAAGVVPVSKMNVGEQKGVFLGKTFVITGALSQPRSAIEAKIKAAGGKISAAVTEKTSALITNDSESGSTKAKKALALGIPIWSEGELAEKIQQT